MQRASNVRADTYYCGISRYNLVASYPSYAILLLHPPESIRSQYRKLSTTTRGTETLLTGFNRQRLDSEPPPPTPHDRATQLPQAYSLASQIIGVAASFTYGYPGQP